MCQMILFHLSEDLISYCLTINLQFTGDTLDVLCSFKGAPIYYETDRSICATVQLNHQLMHKYI